MIKNRAVVVLLSFILAFTFVVGCSSKRGRTARDSSKYIREHNLMQLPKFDLPVEMNDRVVAWMEYFQGPGRDHFRRYLERSGRYVPLMQEILKRQGLPKDLVYIALIESGFNTQAYSRAAAVGPWQFIQSTGRHYGLKQDGWVDERRDPYKSTVAAANFFKDLYSDFGDWYLAMASYNGGPGRVRQAIEQAGSRNFWDLADYGRVLRSETRDYVPKFIAAAIMAKMPERFGFDKIDYKDPFNFDNGVVESQTDLEVIAKCAGVSEEDIKDLNPHLVRGATPPDFGNYEIRLPKGTSKIFHERYADLPKDERIKMARYEVRKGDTLSRVARRYGVRAQVIASANNLNASIKRLPVGTVLSIPLGRAATRYAAASERNNNAKKNNGLRQRDQRYVIEKGESLGQIARRYGVTTKELMVWNHIKNPTTIRTGMAIKIKAGGKTPSEDIDTTPAAAKQEYRVKKGDSLGAIARKSGVTVKQLLAWNNLKSEKHLKSGSKLIIQKSEPQSMSQEVVAKKTDVQQSSSVKYKVSKGDTLGSIARRQNVSVKELLAMNKMNDPRELRMGMDLIVGKETQKKEEQSISPKKADKTPGEPLRLTKKQEPNQSLISDANTLDSAMTGRTVMTPANQENGPVDLREKEAEIISVSKPIIPQAQKPDVIAKTKPQETKSQSLYKVKDGDTLWEIARKHNVTIAQIQKWNKLSDPSAVKPGTTLSIRKE